MKEDVILKVENLSKQYRLGVIGTGTISHDLNRWWSKLRGKEDPFLKIGESNDRSKKGKTEYVWALKDINFEVKRGEVLGIIGKNGAGKSTLLKILSKVTGPTTGSIKSKGRIASLLEVGTGFHPEMTGKENIFLNGAILGMTKKEISSKLDEIVDFSGCERYIDTPVKRYSSGMKVRLAFAVAAFLEPDILVIDEVLAVGDAEFQKKAIGKMQDISNINGRTVLFVSHDLTAIGVLCNKTILLENGKISVIGDTVEVLRKYLNNYTKLLGSDNIIQDPKFIKRVKVHYDNQSKVFSGGKFHFSVTFNNTLEFVTIGYLIKNDNNVHVHAANMQQYNMKLKTINNKNVIEVIIDKLPLVPGNYFLSVFLGNGSFEIESIDDAVCFPVFWDNTLGVIKPQNKWGMVYANTKWNYR